MRIFLERGNKKRVPVFANRGSTEWYTSPHSVTIFFASIYLTTRGIHQRIILPASNSDDT